MTIPGSVWKVVLVVPAGTGSLDSRVGVGSRVIAIKTPNNASVSSTWQSYLTSVSRIETETGLTFFSTLSPATACYLRKVTDTGTGPNTPAVITSFSPDSGPAGCAVTITGYNFQKRSSLPSPMKFPDFGMAVENRRHGSVPGNFQVGRVGNRLPFAGCGDIVTCNSNRISISQRVVC